MMQRSFQWLENHRAVNLLMVIAYVLFLLFAHDVFVNLSVSVMNSLSLPVFQKVVAVIVFLFGVTCVIMVWGSLQNRKIEVRAAIFFVASVLMLVVHFFVLTEMNVEFIHALMYGGLATLLYPMIGRFGGAVLFSLPVMLVDEWYQHVILFPDYTYFYEFNDIVIDLLGAGMFVAMLRLMGIRSKQISRPFYKRPELWLLLGSFLTIITLMITCLIVPYTKDACPNTWLILNKLPEMTAFWYVHPVIGSTFHVLKPVEGLVALFTICLIYLAMDPIRSEK